MRSFHIFRGDASGGTLRNYRIPVDPGMVVLDAVLAIQAAQAGDLAVRWNCKAGKCGSCSAEVNGKPRLMCMTRLSNLPANRPVSIQPMRSFPLIRDLVTDVSWNYQVNQRIRPFRPQPRRTDGTHRMMQEDVERIQEFRKCIECFLCQEVCHVMRDHQRADFIGPRFLLRVASLVMHPLDTQDRLGELKDAFGLGYCNITKCCTEVCPEKIRITDNAIIPLKERVAGRFYDPLAWLWRMARGKHVRQRQEVAAD